MSFYGDIQRWWVGTVEEDSGKTDPNGLGRCRVRIDGIHGPDISLDDLPYAQTLLPATGGGTSGIGENTQLLSWRKSNGIFFRWYDYHNCQLYGDTYLISGIPSITQQNIIAKERRPINQTHSTQNFKSTATNLRKSSISDR